jgi:hypothetical protein
MTVDLYCDAAATTVTSLNGGAAAPAAGTVQTWTVNSSATFVDALGNTASNTATPNRQFRVVDPADSSAVPEIIPVTHVNGVTWTVVRGGEGTTPVVHAAGFTVESVITSESLLTFMSGLFGDGSDGTVTISSDTTLSRDMFYDNLVVNAATNLITKNYKVFARNKLTVTGNIHCDGGAASLNVGGSPNGSNVGSLGYAQGGANGGSTVGSSPGNFTQGRGVSGLVGGASGAGVSGAGAAGGGASNTFSTGDTTNGLSYKNPMAGLIGSALNQQNGTVQNNAIMGGGGGAGGGGDAGAGYTGGGGGAGGGVMVIAARILINNGRISCNGGAGASHAGANTGGGGGGSGGVLYCYAAYYVGALPQCNGGAGGNGSGTGVAGSVGSAGVVNMHLMRV